MTERDYILAAQAALGNDDHLAAMRRLRTEPPAEPVAEAEETGSRTDSGHQ